MYKHEKWMREAIKEAIKAESHGEVPVGAVVIKDGVIIGKGHNQPISMNDATAHAEIQAIRSAGKALKNYRLKGASIYITLEPCSMCLGAISHARIEKIIFGASDSKNTDDLTSKKAKAHKPSLNSFELEGGVLDKECSKLLKTFFKKRR
jgi:tRNA(adenine34) deaminase